MNIQQKWEQSTPEERRLNVDAYLINTSLNEVNTTDQNNFYLLQNYTLHGLNYIIFKITRDENRNITFFFSKLIE